MTVALGSAFSSYVANSVIQNSQQSSFKKNTRFMHPKFGDAACCGGADSSNVSGESGMSVDDEHENTMSLSGKMKDVEELRKKQNPDYLSTLLSKVWPGKVLPGKTGLKKAGLELSIGVATFTFALLAQKAVQHYWIDRESRQAIRQAEKLLRQEQKIKQEYRRANFKDDLILGASILTVGEFCRGFVTEINKTIGSWLPSGSKGCSDHGAQAPTTLHIIVDGAKQVAEVVKAGGSECSGHCH